MYKCRYDEQRKLRIVTMVGYDGTDREERGKKRKNGKSGKRGVTAIHEDRKYTRGVQCNAAS